MQRSVKFVNLSFESNEKSAQRGSTVCLQATGREPADYRQRGVRASGVSSEAKEKEQHNLAFTRSQNYRTKGALTGHFKQATRWLYSSG